MTSKLISASLLLLVSAAAQAGPPSSVRLADVGDLTDVVCQPGQAISAQSLFAWSQRGFGKPSADSSTVNPHAMVATFRTKSLTIKAAIDSRKADENAPNVVRFDCTGKGKFGADAVVALRVPVRIRSQGYFRGTFGPATLQVERGDKTLPVTVQGNYYKSDSHRQMRLNLGRGKQGRCAFGKKVCAVRLVDGNNNLAVGDAARAQRLACAGRFFLDGDTLLIDTGDGTFTDANSVRKVFCGQPVLLGGVWYEVKISPDEMKISAAKADVKAARIKIDHDSWQGIWLGEEHVLSLAGGREPLDVPAGNYVIAQYRETVKHAGGRAGELRRGDREARMGKAKVFEVPAGKTTEIAIGSPMTAGLAVRQSQREVNFSLDLKDASGATIDGVTGRGGAGPTPRRSGCSTAATSSSTPARWSMAEASPARTRGVCPAA